MPSSIPSISSVSSPFPLLSKKRKSSKAHPKRDSYYSFSERASLAAREADKNRKSHRGYQFTGCRMDKRFFSSLESGSVTKFYYESFDDYFVAWWVHKGLDESGLPLGWIVMPSSTRKVGGESSWSVQVGVYSSLKRSHFSINCYDEVVIGTDKATPYVSIRNKLAEPTDEPVFQHSIHSTVESYIHSNLTEIQSLGYNEYISEIDL